MHTLDFDLPTLFTFDKGELKEGRKSPMKRVTVGLGPHHSLDFPTVPGRQTEQALCGLLCEDRYCAGCLMCS